MNARIPVREGTRVRTMSALEALVHTTLTRGLKGDPKAVPILLTLMRASSMLGAESTPEASVPLTTDDVGIVQQYFRRTGIVPSGDPLSRQDATDEAPGISTPTREGRK
jgi:hypothetical protein